MSDFFTKHADKIEHIAGVDCWIWTGASGAGGYGRVNIGGREIDGAHRAAYRAAKGTIPPGAVIRHVCGVRYCVRPDHLKSGTQAENARDTAEMFQTPSSLNITQVRGIRADYDAGLPLKAIAKKYGIAFGSVYPIVCYQNFPYVDPERHGKHKRRLTKIVPDSVVREIRKDRERGETQSAIAKRYGVASGYVSRICRGLARKDVK